MVCKCGHKKEDHLAERRIDENQPLKRIKRYFQCKIKDCPCKEYREKNSAFEDDNKKNSVSRIKFIAKIILTVFVMTILWTKIKNPANNPLIFLWGVLGVGLLFWVFNSK